MTARGYTVYLAGNDGVGKTTQAELLLASLRARGATCRYLWLRFPHLVSAPALLLARALGASRYEERDGARVGRWDFERRPWLARLLMLGQVVDAGLVYALRVLPALWRGDVVVIDRFVYDIVVDIAAAANDPALLESRAARWLCRLAPRGARIVFDAPADTLRERRAVLSHDTLLARRADYYRLLAHRLQLTTLDAAQPVERVQAQLWTLAGRP